MGSKTAMNWTRDFPTVPGFYWVYDSNAVVFTGHACTIVEIYGWNYQGQSGLSLYEFGKGVISLEQSSFTHFMGPIPEPAPPKDSKQ
jgi:hypothetical protein